ARAWPAAESSFRAEHAHAAPLDGASPKEIYSINRLTAGWHLPESPEAAQWVSPPEGRDEEQIEFSWAGETARHVGIVVHRWLQRLAVDELQGWNADRIDGLMISLRRELERRGIRTAESFPAAAMVATALKNTLADKDGQWILGCQPDARNEYRLRIRKGNSVSTYVLDRVFGSGAGEAFIIDYKTSSHLGGNVEAFLDQEVL